MITARMPKTGAIVKITLEWPNGTALPTLENQKRFTQSIDTGQFGDLPAGSYYIRIVLDSDGGLLNKIITKM